MNTKRAQHSKVPEELKFQMVLKQRRPVPLRVSLPYNSLLSFYVFLSSEREDDFSSYLHHKLKSRGISTDGAECLRNRSHINLFAAIEESRIAIVVLSQNYASSPSRLDELAKILECMKDRNRILPIFHGASVFHVQGQKGSYAKAFEGYEEMFRDDLAKVEAWREALTKVCNFAGWTTNDRNEIQVVEEITEAVWNKIHPTPERVYPTSANSLAEFTTINVNEDAPNPMHSSDLTATSVEWNFLITNFGLEILSAGFDQASSPNKPSFALFGMLFSVAALFTCTLELIYKGMKNRVVLKKFRKLWWFYYPNPYNSVPFGTLPDIYGLVGSIAQCVFSVIQYIYFSRHDDSPVKLSLLPAIFLMCLAGSRLQRHHNRR